MWPQKDHCALNCLGEDNILNNIWQHYDNKMYHGSRPSHESRAAVTVIVLNPGRSYGVPRNFGSPLQKQLLGPSRRKSSLDTSPSPTVLQSFWAYCPPLILEHLYKNSYDVLFIDLLLAPFHTKHTIYFLKWTGICKNRLIIKYMFVGDKIWPVECV